MHYIRKILLDALVFSFSYAMAFLLRFDIMVPSPYLNQLISSLLIIILIKVGVFFFFNIYNYDYTYFSVPNVLSILKASSISSVLLFIIFLALSDFFQLPRSILIIDWFLTFVSVCYARFLIKSFRHGSWKKANQGKRVLILGAGAAAESILREIKNYYRFHYIPIGLIDDDPHKHGKIIHGVKILGNSQGIPKIVKDNKIELLIIAIPSATKTQITTILKHCRDIEISVLKAPYLGEIDTEKLLIDQLREIKPEKILFRKQIEWDSNNLIEAIQGKRILVTGAGGSIGSELCRQILKYEPEQLLLFERSEYNLFCINNQLKNDFPDSVIHPIIADVSDYDLTLKITKSFKPDIIFHAAAYKHIFLMELNPEVAIKNNVIGTINIAKTAMSTHADKLIFISTDKAVSPTSIMGVTKRICEEYIRAIAKENGINFYGVRFGNVLGSSGSVLPIFKEQIAQGGPITVTDVNVSRYFMTIPEAVHLVLQTIKFAKGGEMFILNMGKPVRIYDLAKKCIDMCGLKLGEDIDIVFTGLKHGEKVTEELFEKTEELHTTPHKEILKIENNNNLMSMDKLNSHINELLNYASEMNRTALIKKIKEIIPTFQYSLLTMSDDLKNDEEKQLSYQFV